MIQALPREELLRLDVVDLLDDALQAREGKVLLIAGDSLEEYKREYKKRDKDDRISLEQMGRSNRRINSHCSPRLP